MVQLLILPVKVPVVNGVALVSYGLRINIHSNIWRAIIPWSSVFVSGQLLQSTSIASCVTQLVSVGLFVSMSGNAFVWRSTRRTFLAHLAYLALFICFLQNSVDAFNSGGYEDDEDRGETFTYTGAGGRDLSGNKRTAEQSCDQVLTKTNLALAVNCAAKVRRAKQNTSISRGAIEDKIWSVKMLY